MMDKVMAIIKTITSMKQSTAAMSTLDYKSSIAFALTASVFILSQY